MKLPKLMCDATCPGCGGTYTPQRRFIFGQIICPDCGTQISVADVRAYWVCRAMLIVAAVIVMCIQSYFTENRPESAEMAHNVSNSIAIALLAIYLFFETNIIVHFHNRKLARENTEPEEK